LERAGLVVRLGRLHRAKCMIARHRSLSPSDDRIPFLPRPLSLLAADEQMRVAVLARGACFIQCEPSRITSITMQATIDNTMKTSMLPRSRFARRGRGKWRRVGLAPPSSVAERSPSASR